jgi:hypothetical protein
VTVPAVLVSLVVTLLATVTATAAPAYARNRVTPGNFTGFGFDQCVAPTQEAMDTWLTSSPYWAVGIYIAGDSRHCGDDKQVNLSPEWVSTQLRNGWRLLPITVGPQASCQGRYRDKVRISADPDSNYAEARAQGRTEARTTVRAARRLGIRAGSTLWYDLEAFDTGRTRCRESALAFLSAWTRRLHGLDYVSGVYSSAASGIAMLDQASVETPRTYSMPDRVWIADWNGRADTESIYVRPEAWTPGRRVHQYLGGHDETYGGVTINIDSNYLDLGRGSVAPRDPVHCGGVDLNRTRFRRMRQGDDGAQVKVAQCLLKGAGFYQGRLRFRYTRRTERAVTRYQDARDLPANGRMTPRTWTALLTEGPTPLIKVGSASHAVRRAQRALNAAIGVHLPVTGVFDASTTQAVRAYQKERHLRRTGVIAADTWAQLRAGRR